LTSCFIAGGVGPAITSLFFLLLGNHNRRRQK
jgi:hypothetical protein